MKQKYILFIAFLLISFKGFSQNNYSVTSIPFQPFSGTLTPIATGDDIYSGVINLPFSFDFYGATYNQIVISTNGYIDFRTNLAGQYSEWGINYAIPNANFGTKNSILGCYEDLDNRTAAGTLSYGTYGAAPNRKFVVYFYNQPHFQGTSTQTTTFQMILNESTNIVDVQMINRIPSTWQSGKAVIGLVNADGTQAIAPPGRNTGSWTASQEAWRFYRPGYYANYSFVRCDDNTDGFQSFDLSVIGNDLSPANPNAFVFYTSMTDAQSQMSPIMNASTYYNMSNPQTIYARGNGAIKPVVLSVVDCTIDADIDGVASAIEDVNNDTNLANDDTDFDGIPNYLDNDDDGDLVLSNVEYVFNKNATIILDTDNDGTPNYLDRDDDGDGVPTFLEDYNRDGNPGNDDTNANGTPDYLEATVALGVQPVTLRSDAITLYPNPTTNVLNIQNNTDDANASIEIYSVSGAKVKSLKATESVTAVSVSDLQTGVYFVKVTMNNQVGNYKFVKN